MESEYPDASSLISALESRFPSTSIDWEGILTCQYRQAVPKPRTVVDVGSHKGVHTTQFVTWAESVVCFEPISMFADQLRQRFEDFGVVVHEVALSNSDGEASFLINRQIPSESGLHVRKDADATSLEEVRVAVQRLDNYELTHVDFIKIDCEGAEILVLQGANQTISRCRPLVSVEYGWAGYSSYGLTQSSLYEWSSIHEYTIADLFGYLLDTPSARQQCIDRYYWDFFLIPNERLTEIAGRLRAGGREVLSKLVQFRP